MTTQNTTYFSGSDICPVYCFQNYIAKLNQNRPDLWQKEKKVVHGPEQEWYVNQVIGRDILNNTMKTISINAGLSKIYTNHCIRATVVDVMLENDFKNREVMYTTGHKSETSLNSYSTKLAAKKKREISQCLAKQLQQDEPPHKKKTADETPEPVVQKSAEDVPPDFLNMELAQVEEWDNDQNLVAALEKIEAENAHLFQQQATAPAPNPAVPVPGNILLPINQNVGNLQPSVPQAPLNFQSNVSTVSNRNSQPLMYFPGSTVTINYNFSK